MVAFNVNYLNTTNIAAIGDSMGSMNIVVGHHCLTRHVTIRYAAWHKLYIQL